MWEEYVQEESKLPLKESIEQALKEIEESKGVKILLAADTGSRSCSIHSYGSDFDVHFVYVHLNPKRYLTFQRADNKDTIEYASGFKLSNPLPHAGEKVDKIEINCSGFELRKACQLLFDSNAAMVDLIFLSATRESGFRFESNPFFPLTTRQPLYATSIPDFRFLLYNFRRLGLHYRSTAYAVYKSKVNGIQTPIPVKCYLNLIRYTNLAQQIMNTMQQSGNEYNTYEHIDAKSYHAMPEAIQEFQKEMLTKRRTKIWDTERYQTQEDLLAGFLNEQKDFFQGFKAGDPEEEVTGGEQKGEEKEKQHAGKVLRSTLEEICYGLLKSVIIENASN